MPTGWFGYPTLTDCTPVVHLHTPTSANPVCGAPIPADRKRDLTALRSETTCPGCLATLRPQS